MIRRYTSNAVEYVYNASTSQAFQPLSSAACRIASSSKQLGRGFASSSRQHGMEWTSRRADSTSTLYLGQTRNDTPLSRSTRPSQRQLHSTAAPRATRVVDYLLADVGEGITECEIIKWFVTPSTQVSEFDALVEVQSDKATVEITSRYAGKIVEQCYAVGQVARVGSPLCKIEVEDDREGGAAESSAETSDTGASEAHPAKAPSSSSGQAAAASTSSPITAQTSTKHSTLATPAVRRICRDEKVEVSQIVGTGKDGRVTKEDVITYVASRSQDAAVPSSSAKDTASPAVRSEEDVEVELGPIKRAMFRAMSASWNIPHFGYSEELDVTELEKLRKGINGSLDGTATKLTMLPLLLKALSMALYDHALFRCMVQQPSSPGISSAPLAPSALLQRTTHDISIAFSTPSGLLTPTLSDVRRLSVEEIAQHVRRLQDKAAALGAGRGLSRSELGSDRPGSITLSNVGTVGGTAMSPLIPPTGQLAIGAIGKARWLPRYSDGDTPLYAAAAASDQAQGNDVPLARPRLILPTSWTADHRFVEGVELARLVQDWKRYVEKPHTWFFRLR